MIVTFPLKSCKMDKIREMTSIFSRVYPRKETASSIRNRVGESVPQ